MALFTAATAYDNPKYTDFRDRTKYFGESDTAAAQRLSAAMGGQQDPNAAYWGTYGQAQNNALGLANTARGGRGTATMQRSAMLQAPQARQQALQSQYQAQQANYQSSAAAQDFEANRRAVAEGQSLGEWKKSNADEERQRQDTNNSIAAVNGIMSAVGGAAMSDSRTKSALSRRGSDSPQVVIMIGCGEHEHGGYPGGEDGEDDEAGDDALEAMRELEPSNFEYKDEFKGAPGAGDGEYTGIMAQDLERTPAGRGTVATGPDGMKRVDGAKLSTLNSAALSRLVKDVDKLKGAKRG